MAATTMDIGTLITRTPGLHGSSPHILGKGVTVRRIVSWYKRGLSPEEIGDSEALLLTADRIGHLTFAEVYAALTYYHANTAEVEADIAQQTAEAKRLETVHQSVSMSME